MILLCHENNKVISVSNSLDKASVPLKSSQPSEALFEIAKNYPDELLVWHHVSQQENLNSDAFDSVFHHKKIMASFHPDDNYLPDAIGYVDQSPFIQVPKNVSYPTFQMSSLAGGIHASVLNSVPDQHNDANFDYFLNSLAKQLMRVGLFCYSEPSLLLEKRPATVAKASNFYDLFRFTKQHYRTRWVFLLLLNLVIYEKKLKVLPCLYSLFFKRRRCHDEVLDSVTVNSSRKISSKKTMDVIIPTIGRKKYLHDVLKDLSNQTHLPVNVIIVEQNPQPGSTSELDYLTSEKWPFHIDHTFTHQAGACNARNIALSKVKSEWVFFADDDIRFKNRLIENVLAIQSSFGMDAIQLNCLLEGQTSYYTKVAQTTIFGSGCSFVKSESLKKLHFDKNLEFGYGEDYDFGIQIRRSGADVIYIPSPQLVHLKAPVGGFRNNFVTDWDNEPIVPKPSPTLMYMKLKNMNKKQVFGYKTILFLSLHGVRIFKLPFYLKRWNRSIFWANSLKLKNN